MATAAETRAVRGDGRTSGPLRVTIGGGLDVAALKRDIDAMMLAGAPETDIDAYIAAHGATIADLQGQGVPDVTTVDVPASDPQTADKPPAMFAAIKGLAKGAAFPLDLLAQLGGSAMGGLAGMAGASDKMVNALRNPATFGGLLDAAYPTPGSKVEAGFEGVGGAMSGVGIGRMLAAGLPAAGAGLGTTAQQVGAMLAQQPGLQAASGGAAALAGVMARDAGGGVPAQLAAGLAAGVLPFGMAGGLKAGLGAAFSPLTRDYASDGAAQLLREGAADPIAAAARLRAQPAMSAIPGVVPTTAETAGDAGLAGMARQLSAIGGNGVLQDRDAANMIARTNAIAAQGGRGNAGALVTASEAEAARLSDATTAAVRGVGPLTPVEVSGEELRALLATRAEAARKAAGAKFDNLPGGDEPLQVGAYEPNDMRSAPAVDIGRAGFEAAGRESQRRIADAPTGSLSSWVVSQGGVKAKQWNPAAGSYELTDAGSELAAAGISNKTRPGLINANGKTAEQLFQAAREDGWFPQAETDGVDSRDFRLFLESLIDDARASGQGATGRRVVRAEDTRASDAAAMVDNQQWWDREFDSRGLDPQKMTPEDWDAMYRDVEGLEPRSVTQADMEMLGGAGGGTLLSPLQAAASSLKARFFGDDAIGGAIETEFAKLMKADVRSTVEVERLSKRLKEAAGRSGVQTERGAFAAALAEGIDGFLAAVSPPGRRKALAEARKAWFDYKTDFGWRETGAALKKDQFGRPVMDEAKVPGTVVPKGVTGATAAARLTTSAGEGGAEKAVREEVRRAIDAAGADVAGINRVADAYAPALSKFPDIAATVEAARQAATLAQRFAGSPLGRLRDAAISPEAAVARSMRADDGGAWFRSMMGAVRGNLDAEAGLRRALADFVVPDGVRSAAYNASGENIPGNFVTLKALDAMLARTGGSGIFSRDQRGVLIEVRRQLKQQQFAKSAARAPGSDTASNAGLAAKIGRIALEGVAPGAGKTMKAIDVIVGFLGNSDAIREMARKAMLDPKLAAELLERATPSRVAVLRQKLAKNASGATVGSVAIIKEPS